MTSIAKTSITNNKVLINYSSILELVRFYDSPGIELFLVVIDSTSSSPPSLRFVSHTHV